MGRNQARDDAGKPVYHPQPQPVVTQGMAQCMPVRPHPHWWGQWPVWDKQVGGASRGMLANDCEANGCGLQALQTSRGGVYHPKMTAPSHKPCVRHPSLARPMSDTPSSRGAHEGHQLPLTRLAHLEGPQSFALRGMKKKV